jgi:hypothetical protein
MAWITLTEPNGNAVWLSSDQLVRIRIPATGEAQPAAKAIVDLGNGQQAVQETPDQIVAQLTLSAAKARKKASHLKPPPTRSRKVHARHENPRGAR